MTRGRHVVRLAGALSLLVLSAYPARAGAQPAPGSANTVTPPVTPAGVSLVSQTTWVRLRTAFQMVLHIDDPALAARPGAAIALRVHQSTDSRSAFDAVIDDGSLGGTVYQPDPLPVATLPRDPHGNLIVRLGLPGSGTTPTLGVSRPGVYPVEVGLTNTGAPNGSGTFVTWLVTVDTRGGSPVANPLAVSFVWQLVADPATMPDGGSDPAVAQQMLPGGRLDRIATILARAGNLPLSLVVGPETALTWQRLAQHDRHYETGLTRLRAAAARPTVELLPTTYVPIDLTALDAAGLGNHVASEYAAGSNALQSALGVPPDTDTQSAFVDPASNAAIERVGSVPPFAVHFAVRESALAPVIHPYTPAQRFYLDLSTPQPASAASTAPFVERLFDGPAPAALRAERVVAALAEVAYEQPGIARGLVIAPPARWTPDLATMTTVLDALRENPLVQPKTLDDFFAAVSVERDKNGDFLRRHLEPSTPTSTPVSPADYDATAAELSAYREVVGATDPVVVNGEQALLVVLSTSLAPARAQAALNQIDQGIQAFTSGVTTDAKRVTLTARRATIPLSFVNSLKPERSVRVRIHLDSAKLSFPGGADQIVTLKPGNNTVNFAVEARASGTFAMTIRVTSPNGDLAFGAPVRVTVRSAVFGGVAVALTVAALAFLALWWANHYRRTRRGRRLAAPATPAPVA